MKSFKLLCVDCGSEVGETACEITATSYHLCDSCNSDYLNRVDKRKDVCVTAH